MLRNRAEQDRCYARGGAAGWSLLALTVVELPKRGAIAFTGAEIAAVIILLITVWEYLF